MQEHNLIAPILAPPKQIPKVSAEQNPTRPV